ncbi:hypothetical protein Misp04_41450 [Micromonospora sp. NBRC 101691]|nr:hypothetical protein Misp04_41450 [Micromonospora sp. NBRC 101691]
MRYIEAEKKYNLPDAEALKAKIAELGAKPAEPTRATAVTAARLAAPNPSSWTVRVVRMAIRPRGRQRREAKNMPNRLPALGERRRPPCQHSRHDMVGPGGIASCPAGASRSNAESVQPCSWCRP